MDFVIARMQNSYGFISTGKDHVHGFTLDYDSLLKAMKNRDKDFTFAIKDELQFDEHQRAWKKTDNIYLNKLKQYHTDETIELTMLMAREMRERYGR